ncbi:sugar ABC transporter ATP-binding protein [Cellulomonas septica]|uniref:Sugar ABC transporter ATP-binding protein n=1 Tax=Cellulomonas septica TaxID=285080 RepID=A0ABX1JUU4_9CELL|nr:sugar ABC transporter ATP-binding protein [Cellulomonas septica]NKY38084.1 sugar ABC transporter ATP-binding protein [Cellulomonas septica]
MAHSGAIALDVTGLVKSYPGVQALRGVDLQVAKGEIVALCGANGAGKSTLVKILSGAEQPDGGRVVVRGAEQRLPSPHAAREAGICTIYQEMSLVPQMTVLDNIFLDDFRSGLVVTRKGLEEKARRLLDRLGADIDVHATVATLTMAEQQLVEIAKALKSEPAVLLLDEPTTTLPPNDVDALLDVMRDLASQGVGLIFVSHRLDEVTAVCDSVRVLRDGQSVARFDHVPPHHDIVRAMVGERYEHSLAAAAADGAEGRIGGLAQDEVLLEVDGLTDGSRLLPVSFRVRSGEVVGITGLLGAGQNELAECIFGTRPVTGGSTRVGGRLVPPGSPRRAIALGLGLIPEDRKTQGLVLDMSAMKNITLASIRKFSRLSVLRGRAEAQHAQHYVDELRIKCSSVHQTVRTMSGGNQQKVLLARWLTRQSKVLLLAEPTRGVDVAAKEEIYRLIRGHLRRGGGAVVVTSEVSEAALCDRVLVLSSGRVVAELDHSQIQSDHDGFLAHLR